MADTTGPMPLIRWRDEGKRRLGLGFTRFWTKKAAVLPQLHADTGAWTWAAVAVRASRGCAALWEPTWLRPWHVSSAAGPDPPGSCALRLDDAFSVEARDLGLTAADLA